MMVRQRHDGRGRLHCRFSRALARSTDSAASRGIRPREPRRDTSVAESNARDDRLSQERSSPPAPAMAIPKATKRSWPPAAVMLLAPTRSSTSERLVGRAGATRSGRAGGQATHGIGSYLTSASSFEGERRIPDSPSVPRPPAGSALPLGFTERRRSRTFQRDQTRPTGFEDRAGHRTRAAPGSTLTRRSSRAGRRRARRQRHPGSHRHDRPGRRRAGRQTSSRRRPTAAATPAAGRRSR